MIIRNGKTAIGWRLDELKGDGPVGMDMLMNPFAIVPKEENAQRIVNAFSRVNALADALEELVGAVRDAKRRYDAGDGRAMESDMLRSCLEQAERTLGMK